MDDKKIVMPAPREDLEQDVSEETENEKTAAVTNNQDTMVNEENAINDGADEQMLGNEDKGKLTEKREEVKFIKGDHQNGDAKIDIGAVKTFSGMTKEELMKYANDPFWVRLRWIFFIAFWAIWAGMLVGAILIIINSPKCAAPEPLPWYKRGPLVKFNLIESFSENDVKAVQNLEATGAIYELPPEYTYNVTNPEIEKKIKNVVEHFKKHDVSVILDVTPNYVNRDSVLMKNALEDESKRSAFIWVNQHQVPNNWVSIKNGTAWFEILPGNYVLSQFGDGLYDLHMNDTVVKQAFEATLCHLIELGVRGIRLKNTKFYLLTKNIQDEVPASDPRFSHTDYGFWTHSQTVFQEGLGDILEEYSNVVRNCSSGAFLSVAEDLLRPEIYQNSNGIISIQLPIFGRFLHYLDKNEGDKLENEMINTMRAVGNNSWIQWDLSHLTSIDNEENDPSAVALFMSLLPGVPVLPMNPNILGNVSNGTFKRIEQLRQSSSYMHGDFHMYESDELVAYSRIKSGNPGYFVAYNPTLAMHSGNFSSTNLPSKMTVLTVSDNYNITDVKAKSQLTIDSIKMSPRSSLILTYVPIKSD